MAWRGGGRWRVLVIGILVSVVLLLLALRDLDWAALWTTLAATRSGEAVICGIAIGLGILARGWRWSVVAAHPQASLLPCARATNLGVLGNLLLPGRLGEAVRVFALTRMRQTGLSISLGAAVIDRGLDAAVLLASAWAVSMVVAGDVVPSGWIAGLGLAMTAFVAGLFVLRTQTIQTLIVAWSERWLHRWALRPEAFLMVFNAMVKRLSEFRKIVVLAVAIALVFAADYLAVAAALWSIGLDLPRAAALLLWVMLAAGSALPSAPGYVGVYQLAAVLALSIYAVPSHQAIAASLVLQAMTLLVSMLGAGPEILRWRENMVNPRRQTVNSADRR